MARGIPYLFCAVTILCLLQESSGAATVRLVDGNRTNTNKGRVEVYHNGEWGTVCDDFWGLSDARVVCRQLGFVDALKAVTGGVFEPGTGPILLDNVKCDGTEGKLQDCNFDGWGVTNCGHDEDAGVECEPAVPSSINNVTVRLVGGSSQAEGRVEVLHNGTWGTVCDDLWTFTNSRIVCRQLGYREAEATRTGSYYGKAAANVTIWIDDCICRGTENRIEDCPFGGWGSGNCDHGEDVGVVCLSGPEVDPLRSVRLVGGRSPNEGTVEVLYKGKWGRVCDDAWDLEDARVVCRQLDFAGAVRYTTGAYFGASQNSTLIMDNVACAGTEEKLQDCPFLGWGVTNCQSSEEAGVVCSLPTEVPTISTATSVGHSSGPTQPFTGSKVVTSDAVSPLHSTSPRATTATSQRHSSGPTVKFLGSATSGSLSVAISEEIRKNSYFSATIVSATFAVAVLIVIIILLVIKYMKRRKKGHHIKEPLTPCVLRFTDNSAYGTTGAPEAANRHTYEDVIPEQLRHHIHVVNSTVQQATSVGEETAFDPRARPVERVSDLNSAGAQTGVTDSQYDRLKYFHEEVPPAENNAEPTVIKNNNTYDHLDYAQRKESKG
eukprot:m.307022 g.307022  ORF g.307022 m.307022 type:complete len:605 (+) comp41827_c0_seq1:242-2056(+)